MIQVNGYECSVGKKGHGVVGTVSPLYLVFRFSESQELFDLGFESLA